VVNIEEDGRRLQEYVNGLVRLAEQEWQVVFNTDKCEVMHCGRRNKAREYLINGRTRESSEVGGILG